MYVTDLSEGPKAAEIGGNEVIFNDALNYHDSCLDKCNKSCKVSRVPDDNMKRSKTVDAPRPSAGWRVLKNWVAFLSQSTFRSPFFK